MHTGFDVPDCLCSGHVLLAVYGRALLVDQPQVFFAVALALYSSAAAGLAACAQVCTACALIIVH